MSVGESPHGLLTAIIAWVSTNALWIGILTAAYFIVSLVVIRFLVIRMPPDFFMGRKKVPESDSRPVWTAGRRFARNLLGIIVIVIGLVMSIPGVPGQGFLTVLLGITLTDFPGKRRLELRLVRMPVILGAINGLRERAGKPPLEVPDGDDPDGAGGGEGTRSDA
jgi:hypothetical protein